jgi:hypothetical protein
MKRSSIIIVMLWCCGAAVSSSCQQHSNVSMKQQQDLCLDEVPDLTNDEINQLVFDARETGVLSERLEVPRIVWISGIANWIVMKYLQCARWVQGCWSSIKIPRRS